MTLKNQRDIADEVNRRWSYLIPHYTTQTCPFECPCRDFNPHIFPTLEFTIDFYECSQFPFEILSEIFICNLQEKDNWKELGIYSQVSKAWYPITYQECFKEIRKMFPRDKKIFDLNDLKHKEKVEKLENFAKEISSHSAEYCHSGNTCMLENFHSVRANLATKDEYRPKLWKNYSFLICLYRNLGKEETLKRLASKLNIPITEERLKKWREKETKEKKKLEKKKNLTKEAEKKKKKILRKQEEIKASEKVYEYSKVSSLEPLLEPNSNSIQLLKASCGCTTGCTTKRCGCKKVNSGCKDCKCKNCENPFNKAE